MERKAEHDIARKLKVFNHANAHGNISKTCRYFGICRETFYTWRRAYDSGGNQALMNNKPCPENHKLRVPRAIADKIVYLRSAYHFGPDRMVWHLQRYHDIKVSRHGCYQVLKRNKLNRLPENIKKRSRNKFTRYEKKVPGHHVQVDVKFLFFKDEDGQRIKRFQIPLLTTAHVSEHLKSMNITIKPARWILFMTSSISSPSELKSSAQIMVMSSKPSSSGMSQT